MKKNRFKFLALLLAMTALSCDPPPEDTPDTPAKIVPISQADFKFGWDIKLEDEDKFRASIETEKIKNLFDTVLAREAYRSVAIDNYQIYLRSWQLDFFENEIGLVLNGSVYHKECQNSCGDLIRIDFTVDAGFMFALTPDFYFEAKNTRVEVGIDTPLNVLGIFKKFLDAQQEKINSSIKTVFSDVTQRSPRLLTQAFIYPIPMEEIEPRLIFNASEIGVELMLKSSWLDLLRENSILKYLPEDILLEKIAEIKEYMRTGKSLAEAIVAIDLEKELEKDAVRESLKKEVLENDKVKESLEENLEEAREELAEGEENTQISISETSEEERERAENFLEGVEIPEIFEGEE